MKLRILSDLHLEFSGNKFKHIWVPSEEDKDITLLLAGDINVGLGARFFIENLCESFKYVLMVCGNHEYYNNDVTDIKARWRGVEDELPNFHFLDNEWRILDGVRFLGGTMWTDFHDGDPFAIGAAQRIMSDFRYIKIDGRAWRPGDAIHEHDNFTKFLLEEFDKGFNGPTVVVTHHSPGSVYKSEYVDDILNYAYFADLENMIGYHDIATCWFHGHTHRSADYKINNTRVVCNPYGYNGHEVNPGFDKNILFDI